MALPVGQHGKQTSEQRLLALVSCFLAFGADPLRMDEHGVTLAEQAERNGNTRLSLLIKHWGNPQVCDWIQKLLGPEENRPDINGLPTEARDEICDFLTRRC